MKFNTKTICLCVILANVVATDAAKSIGMKARGPGKFLGAVKNGSYNVAENLLRLGDVDLNSSRVQTTPLVQLADEGHLDGVRFLVEHGANPNLTGADGITPLDAAIDSRKLDVIEYIAGLPSVDINRPNRKGVTPLVKAIQTGNQRTIDCVCSLPDVKVNQADESGVTPLMIAAGSKKNRQASDSIINVLLAHNANMYLTDNQGENALFKAARSMNLVGLKALMLAGGEDLIYVRNNERTTVVDILEAISPEMARSTEAYRSWVKTRIH